MLALILACTDYELGTLGDEQVADTDVAERPGDEADEPVEDEPEPPEEEPEDSGWPLDEPDWCTAFDDFSTWAYFGDGNWYIDGGVLRENRGGYYATTAYVDQDFGQVGGFWLEASSSWDGSLNDYTGFVLDLDTAAGTYWVVRVDDPQGDYGRYVPTGRMELAWCEGMDEGGSCTVVASSHDADLRIPSDGTWVDWLVRVDSGQLSVSWNGTVVLDVEVPELTGPGLVGLYSNDNDGGVRFDDFCVGLVD